MRSSSVRATDTIPDYVTVTVVAIAIVSVILFQHTLLDHIYMRYMSLLFTCLFVSLSVFSE